jgi:hypothetical protein
LAHRAQEGVVKEGFKLDIAADHPHGQLVFVHVALDASVESILVHCGAIGTQLDSKGLVVLVELIELAHLLIHALLLSGEVSLNIVQRKTCLLVVFVKLLVLFL